MPQHDTFMAWTWHEPGEPRSLTLEDHEMRPAEGGEVIVDTRAIGLNPVDWKFIAMESRLWQPGQIPGVDAAGVVIDAGPGVDHLAPGDRIAVHTSLAGPGTFATRLRLPARAVMRLPDGIDFITAAAFPCPVLTAWQAIEKLPVTTGAHLLVSGGSGSVGRIIVQLAKARGFHVIAMSSPERHELLYALGADEAISSPHQLTAPLFAVIDTVNGEHARQLSQHLGANGHVVCVQDRLDGPVAPPFERALSQHEVALGALHMTGTDQDWQALVNAGETLLNQVAEGALSLSDVAVDEFDALPTRLSELKHGPRQAGKLVIRVDG
ncbi:MULTISPECIES: alcohol dehydrogenase catalytic domain-containing protein [Halomonas]|uniref:alcohol dehydrogenase catalytic domain-containing protein n=1 Tax=Halomonas TaxID=2745 RepID=UPI001C94F501|nr:MULTISPECIES: alcohol dehydrogenase catalytic domain-containing protein [Halomonas]MBY6207809.1 zinc-binding dehydrogenase [Halomonas sp. DP3Y7-2]MBY6228618.1 zinc-binding dehydrogenase [Halomonas sp. DP3Y7-1]MCA0916684.1 zinc-binding dehydrogenase [Halomonas denitrificans]